MAGSEVTGSGDSGNGPPALPEGYLIEPEMPVPLTGRFMRPGTFNQDAQRLPDDVVPNLGLLRQSGVVEPKLAEIRKLYSVASYLLTMVMRLKDIREQGVKLEGADEVTYQAVFDEHMRHFEQLELYAGGILGYVEKEYTALELSLRPSAVDRAFGTLLAAHSEVESLSATAVSDKLRDLFVDLKQQYYTQTMKEAAKSGAGGRGHGRGGRGGRGDGRDGRGGRGDRGGRSDGSSTV